jgi:hypothetical protein
MIPIHYEEGKSSLGMPVVKASIRLNGGVKTAYGATRAEARQKLVEWLGNYYDLAPEAFVTLPTLEPCQDRPKKSVKDGLVLMILVFVVVSCLAFIARFA